jgi:hypothetical protein
MIKTRLWLGQNPPPPLENKGRANAVAAVAVAAVVAGFKVATVIPTAIVVAAV